LFSSGLGLGLDLGLKLGLIFFLVSMIVTVVDAISADGCVGGCFCCRGGAQERNNCPAVTFIGSFYFMVYFVLYYFTS
jgi:hypothetical protein